MNGKIFLVLAMITGCLLLNGCFFKEVTSDMAAEPKNSIYGAWFDESNKTYLELNHDNTYTFGYGKYSANSGGTFTVDDKQIVLKVDYAMIDGKKQMISDAEKEDMVLPYSFSLGGNLKIKTDNISLDLRSVPADGVPETTTNAISGYWLNVSVKESIRFDSSGNYTKSFENGTNEKGTYEIDGGTLKVTINGETKTFEITYENKDRFTIKTDGKTSTFERMGD